MISSIRNRDGVRWFGVVGEVLIVIVGVGIALGAESWWTGRQDLARETEHMLALRSNFEENVDSLRGAIENHRGIQRSAAALMSIANGLDASPGADSLRALA